MKRSAAANDMNGEELTLELQVGVTGNMTDAVPMFRQSTDLDSCVPLFDQCMEGSFPQAQSDFTCSSFGFA